MKRYSERELYAFVWRADTRKKIAIAEQWLKGNVDDNDLFDDLMVVLSLQERNINRAEELRELI